MLLDFDATNTSIADADKEPRNAFFSNTAPLVLSAHSLSYKLALNSTFVLNLTIRGAYHRLRDDRESTDFAIPPDFAAGTGDFVESDFTEFDRNTSDQYILSADLKSVVSQKTVINWGMDVSYDFVSSKRLEQNDAAGTFRTLLPRYPDGSSLFRTGIFAHLDYQLSERINLVGGGRYSFIGNYMELEGADTERGFDPFSRTFSQLTGIFGVSYRTGQHSKLSLNISNGFRAPNVAEFSELGIRRGNRFQTPNSDIRPETTSNIDLGYEISTDVIQAEIAGFWIHYFDKIEAISTGNIVDADGNFMRAGTTTSNSTEFIESRNVNANALDIFGLESRIQYRFNRKASVGGTFNFTWGELTKPNGRKEPGDRIPPANGILYFDLIPVDGISLRPQALYAFTHRRISTAEKTDNRINPGGTDGFINYQLLTNVDFGGRVSFKVAVDNVLNRTYREHASTLDGLGRNATVTVKYSMP